MTDKIMKEYYYKKLRDYRRYIKFHSDFNPDTLIMTPSLVHDDVSTFKEVFLRVDTVWQLIIHEFMSVNRGEKPCRNFGGKVNQFNPRKISVVGTSLEPRLKQILLFQKYI